MAKYFLIEARSPFESPEVNHNYQLAMDLAQAGHQTTLFLVENGVFSARQGLSYLSNLDPVTVLVDEFSLRERGITADELSAQVQSAPIGAILDAMAEGQKTLWL